MENHQNQLELNEGNSSIHIEEKNQTESHAPLAKLPTHYQKSRSKFKKLHLLSVAEMIVIFFLIITNIFLLNIY
jgi:hypothetical protein